MTTSTSLDAPAGSPSPQAPPSAPQPPAAAPPSGPPPAITASRGRLDNRFPSLAFNIRTQGHPYFEVLLATDRSLFDPAAASRRTPSNFYAGRQDGGLLHATAGDTAYIVPAAVLRRFADAKPRPGEIFYTVAVYDMPDGPPLLAQPPAMLATMAPSVMLGADYQAKTMAAVLSIPVEKLQTMNAAPGGMYSPQPRAFGDTEVDDDGMPAGQAASWSSDAEEAQATEQAAAALAADPHAQWLEAPDVDEPADVGMEAQGYEAGTYAYRDDADGDEPDAHGAEAYGAEAYGESYDDEPEAGADAYEDGYDDEPAAQGYGEAAEAEAAGYAEPYSADDDYDESYGDSEAYEDVDEDYDGAQAYGGDEESPATEEPAGATAYDDGYDDEMAGEQSAWAEAAEASFPPGAAEPAQLADVDDERVDQEIAAAYAAYGNGNGHHGNGAAAVATPPPLLDIPGRIALLSKLGRKCYTPAGYTAVDADPHGLHVGFLLWGPHGGRLGRLLAEMRKKDTQKFDEIFAPHVDELMQKAGRAEQWDSAWLARIAQALQHPPFQAVQNELAVRDYLEPMLETARALDMTTERALAMLVERAIAMGPQRAAEALHGVGAVATRDELMDRIVAGVPRSRRLRAIRTDPEFGDVPLSLQPLPPGA